MLEKAQEFHEDATYCLQGGFRLRQTMHIQVMNR